MDSNYKTEKINKNDFDFRRYTFFQKIWFYIKNAWGWLANLLGAIFPDKLFKKGAGIAALILVILVAIVLGVFVKTGLWIVLDIPVGILLVAIGALGLGLALGIVFRIFYEITRIISWKGLIAMGAVASIFKFIALPLPLAIGLAVVFVLVVSLLGGTIALFFDLNFKYFSWPKKIWIFVVIILVILFNIYVVDWLLKEGTDQYLSSVKITARDSPQQGLDNPAQVGPFATLKMSYGSGTDKRRREFAKEAQIKTKPVNASKLLIENSSLKMKLRKSYWGFDASRFPLNGMVWFPKGEGLFPLILVIHGSSRMEIPSHRGFEYMGPLLASKGFVMAAIDESFLNPSWHGKLKNDIRTRAWLILKHLQLWRAWHTTSTNPFYGIVDLNNIGLLGHGCGGEAAVVAALFNRLTRLPGDASMRFDFNFRIRSILAVAPTEGNYMPAGHPLTLENLNYLLLQGAHDARLFQCEGEKQFQRITFNDSQYWLKTRIYSQRANHSRFNSVWSGHDMEFPMNLVINRKALLESSDQFSLLKIFTVTFMETTLKNKRAYLPLLRDIRFMMGWLPRDFYLTRFQDSHFLSLCDFEEDVDVTSGTLKGSHVLVHHISTWREGALPLRKGDWNNNKVVYLGWQPTSKANRVPSYTIQLPENSVEAAGISKDSLLVFSMADGRDITGQTAAAAKPIEVFVELITRDRNVKLPLQQFGILSLPLQTRFTKFKWDHLFCPERPEIILQTFELPMASFLEKNAQLDLSQLKAVRFSFDGSKEGLLVIDDVGFAKPPPAPPAPAPKR